MENEIKDFLNEMGLDLEDILEPDLNKQKEYYNLLVSILDSSGPEQEKLLNYAWEIIQIDIEEKRKMKRHPVIFN